MPDSTEPTEPKAVPAPKAKPKAKPRKPRPRAPRPAFKKLAARPDIERLERVDYLRSNILLLERAAAESQPGTIAYIQTLRAQMDARNLLDKALEKGNKNPWDGLSDEELREKLRAESDDMPTPHLAILAEVYCERVGAPFPLRAVAGGR